MTIQGSSGYNSEKEERDLIEKQNRYIALKYMILGNNDFFNVIKRLEAQVYNLQESLKLSQELNAIHEKIIKKGINNDAERHLKIIDGMRGDILILFKQLEFEADSRDDEICQQLSLKYNIKYQRGF